MCRRDLSVCGALRWPVIREPVLLLLGVGALAFETLLFCGRRHVSTHEIGVSLGDGWFRGVLSLSLLEIKICRFFLCISIGRGWLLCLHPLLDIPRRNVMLAICIRHVCR